MTLMPINIMGADIEFEGEAPVIESDSLVDLRGAHFNPALNAKLVFRSTTTTIVQHLSIIPRKPRSVVQRAKLRRIGDL